MGKKEKVIPRVVLDTNCVVSALLFSHGQLGWLRAAWQARRFVPLLDKQTTQELIRVLAYPKFRLNPAERQSMLEEFLPFAEVVAEPSVDPPILPVRDEDDAKFLRIAASAKADVLVSGDQDLLTLRGEAASTKLLNPLEFRDWLERR